MIKDWNDRYEIENVRKKDDNSERYDSNEDECSVDTKLRAQREQTREKYLIEKLNQDKNAKVHFGCALARDIEQHFKNHDV